ncbi:hypothetical protein A3C37_02725 [Candidatus Peribacteria bacterium RIFCSPHIGHO2_02_FULL_53_20]|nr:MAG: hypothetical protein A3C37_02725 [Candidatus Peribacteria bacterium RIFCSPHIGHO2_02_FULL_53_20]OGJ70111.1 MAG: hypothetical protein A3G69_02795 [Candidatus Peribacteria bacterium RIFCSPLOWO2_12_FULL_53_10]HLC66453.1 type II toxin-antitoxin system HicA family toxin [Candidatus Nanoarchaeia archaeon]
MLKLFESKGWKLVRVRGSHHIFHSTAGKVAVVPVHGNDSVHVGILNNLLRKHLALSEEEIEKL